MSRRVQDRSVDTSPVRFASEPVAELVNEPYNPIDPGTAYVRLTVLGTTLNLSVADAVSVVDEIACALAGVTP